MTVYRIASEEYAGDLRGEGARLFGGRWNSEGIPLLYCSGSRALALLEQLAHLAAPLRREQGSRLIALELPVGEAQVEQIPQAAVVDLLREPSETHPFRTVGDAFVRNARALVLRVPSVILPRRTTTSSTHATPVPEAFGCCRRGPSSSTAASTWTVGEVSRARGSAGSPPRRRRRRRSRRRPCRWPG